MDNSCAFCLRPLGQLTLEEREKHEFGCTGKSQSSLHSIIGTSRLQSNELDTTNEQRICDICKKSIRGSLDSRQTHVRNCAKKAKLNDSKAYELVVKERDFLSDSSVEAQVKVTKPKKKRKAKRKIPLKSPYFEEPICLLSDSERSSPVRTGFDALLQPRRKDSIGSDTTVYSQASFQNPNLKRNNAIFKSCFKSSVFSMSQLESPPSPDSPPSPENPPSPREETLADEKSFVFHKSGTKRKSSQSTPSPDSPPSPKEETLVDEKSFVFHKSGTKRKSSQSTASEAKQPRQSQYLPPASNFLRPLASWNSPLEEDTNLDEQNTSFMNQLNETRMELQINTIEGALTELRVDALQNGDLLKLSSTGDRVRFHSFWVRARCPALLKLNTKTLSTTELKELHNVMYSSSLQEVPQLSSDDDGVFTSPVLKTSRTSKGSKDSFSQNTVLSGDDEDEPSIIIQKSKPISNQPEMPVPLESPMNSSNLSAGLFDKSSHSLNSFDRIRRSPSPMDIPLPDFTPEPLQPRSFNWNKPAIILSSDDEPLELDMSRLNVINEDISILNIEEEFESQPPESFRLPETKSGECMNSAPTTPRKRKQKNNDVRSLNRRSISLNPNQATSSPLVTTRVKSAVELKVFHDAGVIYDKMEKEDLIEECAKFGMKRSLGKRVMITKLKEIHAYKMLHCDGELKKVTFPTKAKIDRRIQKHLTDEGVSDDSEEDISNDSIHQTFADLEQVITEEQADINKMKQISKLIQGLPYLHEKVLRYEPIGLKELESYCVDKQLNVNETFLITFCDKYCITFFQEKRKHVKGSLRARKGGKK